MGAGASADASEKLAAASAEELAAMVKGLPQEAKDKLAAAVAPRGRNVGTHTAAVVAELQKNGMWDGVLPAEVEVATLPGIYSDWQATGLGMFTPPQNSGASTVVVKLSQGDHTTTTPCHVALSEHGVAVPLLAYTLDFTVEAFAKRRTNEDTPEGDLKQFLDNAEVTARLHGAPITWFDGYCRKVLQDYVPLLEEEPLNSALYIVAAHRRTQGIPKEDLPQTDKLRELMAVLPRPVGEHAERLVAVHGDLWDANILHMPGGGTVLCDFEQSVVSSAVQDLVHVSEKPLVAAYLEAMTGKQPSEEEVHRLWLEARIAEHVHFYVLRALFLISGDDEPVDIDERIEHSRLFGMFAGKCREDSEYAKKWLNRTEDENGETGWRDSMNAALHKL